MDKIKFIGYSADGQLKSTLRNRVNPMDFETFYKAVNQVGSGCSCCKQEGAKVYAIQPVGIFK